jgi:site-specific DNA-methyltransferase (adenine-specific)
MKTKHHAEAMPEGFSLSAEPQTTAPKNAPSAHGTLAMSCEDCMALMRRYPDRYFDLAIVDPPYGISAYASGKMGGGVLAKQSCYAPTKWDTSIPPNEYFAELRRVSRNQIIWGGNYFPLPPSPCWLVWDKLNGENNFADCELAWTSYKTAVRKFAFRWQGMLQGNMAEKEGRIHPTQKPVALYRWLLKNYAAPGQRILDTHLGSGSHAIACHYAGMHLTACEIDADYFAAAQERIARETAQATLFPSA